MPYGLSFSTEFFLGRESLDELSLPNHPTSVMQAIMNLSHAAREEVAEAVFGVDGETLDPWLILEQVRQTDTCSNLDSPVEVWIDRDGFFTLFVYDAASEEESENSSPNEATI